jgi:hypothetical protein
MMSDCIALVAETTGRPGKQAVMCATALTRSDPETKLTAIGAALIANKRRIEMTDENQLMRQNILEYESRIKHFDELIARADSVVGKGPEHAETRDSLASLKQQRDKFAVWLDERRLKSLENWRAEEIEKAGPMGIWDAVGQQLEKLVERIER